MQNTIPILRFGKMIITSIHQELHDKTVDDFQNNTLQTIEGSDIKGLIIDISVLDSVDSYVAKKLVETGAMARLMGVHTVIVGIRPEVAATLTRMGFKFQSVHTTLSLEEGINLINNLLAGGIKKGPEDELPHSFSY
jgi:rsbT antagonist protein RsbS